MIALGIGAVQLIYTPFQSDPQERAKHMKSAFFSLGIGLIIMILFSKVLRR